MPGLELDCLNFMLFFVHEYGGQLLKGLEKDLSGMKSD